MPQVSIFWDPRGIELDTLGTKEYLRATDGDTPYVSMPIRMLSIDTPEVHYPGNRNPSKQDENLAQLADWIKAEKAPISSGLAKYLYPKLATGTAGTLQESQGNQASNVFKTLLDEKLTKPDGSKRKVFLRVADENFDQYGRLLAYLAPWYSSKEKAAMLSPRERATFNLLMTESGWAAPFLIYPSIPKHPDLVKFQEVARDAYLNKKGAWADSMMLTGHEFRMCVRLYEVTKKLVKGQTISSRKKDGWVTRFCADITTRKIFYPQNYYQVPPYNRIFIWPDDVTEAVGRLNLVPAE